MLPIPGPRAVLSVAGRAGTATIGLLGVPGRVLRLLDRVEETVDRLDVLLDAATATAERADRVAVRAGQVAEGAAVVTGEAHRVSGLAGAVTADAGELVAGAAEIERVMATLTDGYAPLLVALRPALARMAETIDVREIEAMVGLIDRLPPVLDSVDGDVLPLLGHLNEMAPDLHALLEAVVDLRLAVAGLPGIGILKRRGEEELGEAAELPPADGTAHGATRARH